MLKGYSKVTDVMVQTWPEAIAMLWGAVKFSLAILTVTSPTAIRWYRVPKEVMKKFQQRNILRSRIMNQQIILLHV